MNSNEENIKVSIIIPSYNHEKYIEEAVRSVWSQTYKYIELIVIDDGSTDSSVKILGRLNSESPIPMKVLCKRNEGICKTLNLGLSMSRGKYISVLASDDRYLKDKFEQLVPLIEASDQDVSFIYSNNTNIGEDGTPEQVLNFKGLNPSKNLFEDILLFKTFPTLSSMVIKKEKLIEVGCFNEKYRFEDYDLLLRLTRFNKAIFSSCVTFEYRGGVISSLGKNIDLLYRDLIQIFEENIKLIEKYRNRNFCNYAYGRLYSRVAESYYMNNNFSQARLWARKSIFSNPFQYKAFRIYFPCLLSLRTIGFLRKVSKKILLLKNFILTKY